MFKKLIERIQANTQRGAAAAPAVPLPLAAAALLMEVAAADHNVTAAELAQIRSTIGSRFQLDSAALQQLMDDSEQTVATSVGIQPLTRALTTHWSEPERFELVLALWQVALADQTVDAFEEHRIRSIAELLYVSHSRFIEAKLSAKRNAAD